MSILLNLTDLMRFRGYTILTQEFLKDHFEYRDGHLYRIKATKGSQVGKRFGQKDKDGYIVGRFFYKVYKEHKLIWLYHYGVWPNGNLDHVNVIPDDNRIENLREADKQSNAFNRKSHKNSTSKYKGVSWCKRDKNWQVSYCIGGKRIYIGKFNCEIEAAKAYDNTVREYHKEFQKVNINDFS